MCPIRSSKGCCRICIETDENLEMQSHVKKKSRERSRVLLPIRAFMRSIFPRYLKSIQDNRLFLFFFLLSLFVWLMPVSLVVQWHHLSERHALCPTSRQATGFVSLPTVPFQNSSGKFTKLRSPSFKLYALKKIFCFGRWKRILASTFCACAVIVCYIWFCHSFTVSLAIQEKWRRGWLTCLSISSL